MAKSFLEAVEEAMPLPGNAPAETPDDDELDDQGQPVLRGPEEFTQGDEEPEEVTYEDLLGLAAAGTPEEAGAQSPVLPAEEGAADERVLPLFEKTLGGGFDPGSKNDQAKMRLIQELIQEDPSLLELSPAKFAMKVYARR